jgi:hypothetical protein
MDGFRLRHAERSSAARVKFCHLATAKKALTARNEGIFISA